jgi:hypothetical protein
MTLLDIYVSICMIYAYFVKNFLLEVTVKISGDFWPSAEMTARQHILIKYKIDTNHDQQNTKKCKATFQ